MRKLTADFVFPVITAPLKNGVAITDDQGKILSLDERENFEDAELEIHKGIITPGFINAHCHLELSYMKGKIPAHSGIVQFIMDVIDYRNGFTLSLEGEHLEIIYDAIRKSEQEMFENGIVAVGDISNDDYTFDFKANSGLKYHTFVECFGFYPEKAENYFNLSMKVFHEALEKNSRFQSPRMLLTVCHRNCLSSFFLFQKTAPRSSAITTRNQMQRMNFSEMAPEIL